MKLTTRLPLAVALLSACAAAPAQTLDFVSTDGFERLQAMRIVNLQLRDPHLFTQISIFCTDITDSANAQINSTLSADSDEDGYLDNSPTLLFRPLHSNGRRGLAHVGNAVCTAPSAGTSCEAGAEPPQPIEYGSLAVGTCLAPIPGTVRPYAPAVDNSVGPCFASDQAEIDFDIGMPLPLQDIRLGGSWRESPTPGLGNGLLYGFLTEEAAAAMLITLPLIGTVPLASLLPGGTGNCAAHSDRDVHNDVPGWWFYFNYIADQVPYVE